jgi:hypothetical protein
MDRINKLFGLLNYDQYKTWKPTINCSKYHIAFQKEHPNLNLMPWQINQHWIKLKNKNKIIFQHPKSKPWTFTKTEYLFRLDKKFLNLNIKNIRKLFYEWCNDINLNPIQVQWHLKYLRQK